MTSVHFKFRTGLLLAAALLVSCSSESSQESSPASQSQTHEHKAPGAELDHASACSAHGAAKDQCFICDPALRDPQRLWCAGHARYEDRCWMCHPELQDADRLYCDEHGLYEDECFICHPETSQIPAASGDINADLFCNEHGVAERECGICQPTLADALQPGQGLKIRMVSERAADKAGIRASRLHAGETQPVVAAVGEVTYDQNRLARLTPPAAGVVRRVSADLGDKVVGGQVLAEISSPAIAEAKAELLEAAGEELVHDKARKRAEELFKQKVISERDLDEARAQHQTLQAKRRAAEQMLLNLGLTRQDIDNVLEDKNTDGLLLLRAPFAGTVIERDAVLGDVVTSQDPLFSVADISGMWVRLAVPEEHLAELQEGLLVEVTSQKTNRTYSGRVTWIASELSESTRLAAVRVEVENPDRSLRAGMFVTAAVATHPANPTLVVDRDAVHRFGGHPFVFVQLTDDLFELRRVHLGVQRGNQVPVVAGLTSDDLVVTNQSFLVKSEFQKSRLGAGCVH